MKKTLLIIEDDKKIVQLLTEYLTSFGYEVVSSLDPNEGLRLFSRVSPDLVILDVMMPNMDGFEVCRRIRKENNTPIIMLTARGDLSDKVVGLELGADDYLPKPFEPRELVARVQSVLRRAGGDSATKKIKLGSIEIDMDRQIAKRNEKELSLTTKEFELLALFMKNEGKVLNRDQIMDAISGFNWEAFDRSIDVLISRVRQKIEEDPKKPELIRTIYGAGYKFTADE